jgi:hypothetical protein
MTQAYHDRPTQLLPKEDVAVVIWGNKITNDVSHPIRFHASKEVARNYLGNQKEEPTAEQAIRRSRLGTSRSGNEKQTRHVKNL